MRSKNEVLCAAAGRLAAERSEADKPAKAHKTIFSSNVRKLCCCIDNAKVSLHCHGI
jgi:hypothetical protein